MEAAELLVRQAMTPHVEVVFAESTLREAAELMRAVDAGSLPVVDAQSEVVGMVTDRDIVVRGLALGLSGDSQVSEVMTARVYAIPEDETLREAVKRMRRHEVRRLVVLDERGRLVGVLSLGDLAEVLPDRGMGALLGDLSEPAASVVT